MSKLKDLVTTIYPATLRYYKEEAERLAKKEVSDQGMYLRLCPEPHIHLKLHWEIACVVVVVDLLGDLYSVKGETGAGWIKAYHKVSTFYMKEGEE